MENAMPTKSQRGTTRHRAKGNGKGSGRYAELGREAGRQGADVNRRLQKEAEKKETKQLEAKQQKKPQGKKEGAVQPPDRQYPAPPNPKQHQAKPGIEAELEPRPAYAGTTYRPAGKLEGMVALVTGGDSGIGRSVAVLYAREGADVAIVYLNEHEDANETRQAIESEGRRAVLIPGDVTDSAFCRDAVNQTMRELGKLDILVNNAAFQQHAASLEEITDEQWDRTFRTNIYGYFYMSRAALPHLDRGGVILNTGSVTGIEGSKQLLDYSATKGAIHAFTKSLAQNVVDRGIRVNAVAPGPVWTPLNPADKPPEKVAEFGTDVPMKRPAQPEEIAPAFVFLASSADSSYITGEVLPILGGETVA
jgi:NAD(P)-dependent dehydrogenase (short-subunit alcohol dehydrogenase family)